MEELIEKLEQLKREIAREDVVVQYLKEKENIFKNLISVNIFCVQKDLDIKVIDIVEVLDSSFHPMKR